jgi:hypothetical protein
MDNDEWIIIESSMNYELANINKKEEKEEEELDIIQSSFSCNVSIDTDYKYTLCINIFGKKIIINSYNKKLIELTMKIFMRFGNIQILLSYIFEKVYTPFIDDKKAFNVCISLLKKLPKFLYKKDNYINEIIDEYYFSDSYNDDIYDYMFSEYNE